eukprot:12387940-Alexandrium_andersonii.AAC.1
MSLAAIASGSSWAGVESCCPATFLGDFGGVASRKWGSLLIGQPAAAVVSPRWCAAAGLCRAPFRGFCAAGAGSRPWVRGVRRHLCPDPIGLPDGGEQDLSSAMFPRRRVGL